MTTESNKEDPTREGGKGKSPALEVETWTHVGPLSVNTTPQWVWAFEFDEGDSGGWTASHGWVVSMRAEKVAGQLVRTWTRHSLFPPDLQEGIGLLCRKYEKTPAAYRAGCGWRP